MSIQEKKTSLESVIANIRKKHGSGSVMWYDEKPFESPPVIPSGSIGLDLALGIGGIPRGRIVELIGAESAGKTTLCLHIIAEAQKLNGVAAFVDVEHSMDPVYAKSIGVNLENILISQPDSAEEALDILRSLAESGDVDMIVLDSVAALAPRAEIAKEIGDSHVGLQSRLVTQAVRILTSTLDRTKTVLVATNQLRDKIGMTGYGPKTTTTGGRALRHAASVRLEVRRIKSLDDGDEKKVGHTAQITVVKNKMAPPYKAAEVDIIYGDGIVKEREIINLAAQYGIVQKSGAWFKFDKENIGQGISNSVEALINDKDLTEKISSKLIESINNGGKKNVK